jgi:glutathione synthase/RimK-type ligase-like ATP-grasp enzyme
MKTVLCVGGQADALAMDLLDAALAARGARALRFHLDRYPSEGLLHASFDHRGYQGFVQNHMGQRVDLDQIDAIWFRRLASGQALPSELAPGLRRACLLEIEAAALGVLASLPCRQLDPPFAVIRAEQKALQLAVARRTGLPLPATLTSNDPEAVQAWARGQGALITKMLSASEVQTLRGSGAVPTTAVGQEALEDLSGLSLAPLTLQARVARSFEARAVVVGRRVLAARLDSQALEGAPVDWRQDSQRLAPRFRAVQPPPEICAGLLALTEALGLRHGSADLIGAPDGSWTFLEINPGGEWHWMQHHAGLDIAGALADELLGVSP